MDAPINTMEELLSDESFLAWYFKTDPQAVDNWNNRIASDPSLGKLVNEAVQLLQTIIIKEQRVDVQRIKQAEIKLNQNTGATAGNGTGATVVPLRSRKKWWAAAAIIFLTSVGVWQYNRTNGRLAIQTAYGETRQDVLPDGSQVMLNANTTLDYKKWKEGKDREVWVKGEAFFHVKRTALKTRFIVHTEHFDVVVTGTQFNVINRNNKNNVLLKEGSVIIKNNGQEVHMQPGDYVEFDSTGIQKKNINNASVLAWTEHKFIFDNTPMKEVASLVTEIYGVKVNLAQSITDSTVNGFMPNDNLDVLLQALGALGKFDVVQSDQEIMIRKK
jgi:transmembrane sensor